MFMRLVSGQCKSLSQAAKEATSTTLFQRRRCTSTTGLISVHILCFIVQHVMLARLVMKPDAITSFPVHFLASVTTRLLYILTHPSSPTPDIKLLCTLLWILKRIFFFFCYITGNRKITGFIHTHIGEVIDKNNFVNEMLRRSVQNWVHCT